MTCTSFLILGYTALLYVAYRLINTLYGLFYPFFIATSKDLHQLAGAKWAVITGATDGIGKAYAEQLAEKGFKIFLISRSEEKLKSVAKQIEKVHGVETQYLQFDFTEPECKKYESVIRKRLEKLDVGILVNNVGMTYDYAEKLHEIAGGVKTVTDMVVINTLPVLLLTAIVLPQMVDRNRGIIINIASAASLLHLTQWAIYSSSKKYMTWLSGILRQEYSNTNIIFQAVCPGLVTTKLSKATVRSFFTAGPGEYVQQALRTVGIVDDTTGYFPHQLWALGLCLPDFMLKPLVARRIAKRTRGAGPSEGLL